MNHVCTSNDTNGGELVYSTSNKVATEGVQSSTNNSASFAERAFYETTGTDVDADDGGGAGTETPRELGKSIRALNGGKNQGPWVPPVLSRPQGSNPVGQQNPDSSSFSGKHCFPFF